MQEKADVILKFKRYHLVKYYKDWSFLPPPFTVLLLPYIYSCWQCLLRKRANSVTGKLMNGKLASNSFARNYRSYCSLVFLKIKALKNFVKFAKLLKNAKYEMPQILFIQVNQSSIEIFKIKQFWYNDIRQEKVRELLIHGGKLASF